MAFGVNMGSDRVYASKRGGKVLEALCTQTKKLKTFKEQSVFTMDRDYFFKAEGSVIKNYKTLFIIACILFLYYTKQELNAILQ